MDYTIIIIVVSLLFSAFFSGMEIAYVSSNKIHIEIEKKQEGWLAKVLTKLTVKPSKFIATMLVGNNIALVVYGFYMGELIVSRIYPGYMGAGELPLRIILVQTLISTFVILITGEFLPKVFFQVYANKLLRVFAFPAYIFYMLFSFISELVIRISDFILKAFFKTKGDEVQLTFSKVELGDYISEQMEAVEDEDEIDSEIQIFQNALEFSDVKAREVMVPRTEIVAVELHESPKSLVKLFTETGYSKILIYKDTIDNIIGYVHSFELFKKPRSIKNVMLPVEFVPETMLINDILGSLTKKRKSIAVVLDEYGGTSGILTVEDIVEELFGEIEDEHDTVALYEEQIGEKEFKFSARLEVDYINEEYKLELPENENYETLGGLIVNYIGEIPGKGEEVVIGDYHFTILEVGNTKIDLVQLEIVEEE
ncbi:hemolysin family protein [Sinomicrobium weinanense]|uniref:HlyC/CorC family transporter n=1 Tax=Sinomicrobium weinanense TaxID=2842200 RepID=A0A926JUS3_9FLAO|nr:hemolysin family protein [Sinomicrobium weinanense]MBC9797571.1 HlyC/CorC family transporter [Sinomicrobium weinanense]MBU3123638.1 hemolysin family protein [Sinomicrobium weinanense]